MTELLQQSFPIKLHLVTALLAVILGLMQLIMPKGKTFHKLLGWTWVVTMLIVAFSSFWITKLMTNSPFFGFSVIHLLSIMVIFLLIGGIFAAKRGNITLHKHLMRNTYIGLIIAGLFTLLPGRLLHTVLFTL